MYLIVEDQTLVLLEGEPRPRCLWNQSTEVCIGLTAFFADTDVG